MITRVSRYMSIFGIWSNRYCELSQDDNDRENFSSIVIRFSNLFFYRYTVCGISERENTPEHISILTNQPAYFTVTKF